MQCNAMQPDTIHTLHSHTCCRILDRSTDASESTCVLICARAFVFCAVKAFCHLVSESSSSVTETAFWVLRSMGPWNEAMLSLRFARTAALRLCSSALFSITAFFVARRMYFSALSNFRNASSRTSFTLSTTPP